MQMQSAKMRTCHDDERLHSHIADWLPGNHSFFSSFFSLLFKFQMHHPIQMKPADSEKTSGKWMRATCRGKKIKHSSERRMRPSVKHVLFFFLAKKRPATLGNLGKTNKAQGFSTKVGTATFFLSLSPFLMPKFEGLRGDLVLGMCSGTQFLYEVRG